MAKESKQELKYGQCMMRELPLSKKMLCMYIVSKNPEDEVQVKLAYKLPYKIGDAHKFVNYDYLKKHWFKAEVGMQLSMMQKKPVIDIKKYTPKK